MPSATKTRPTLIVAQIMTVMLATVIAITGCDQSATEARTAANTTNATTGDPTETPSPAPQPMDDLPRTTGGPQIAFDSTVIDFGTISDTTTYPASFTFTNTGDRPLVVSDVKASCGCTATTLSKKTYAPGESGTLDVVFNPKRKKRAQSKNITVTTNSVNDKVLKLKLNAFIATLVDFEPGMVKFGSTQLGQELYRPVTLTYTDPDLKIVKFKSNNPVIEPSLVEAGVRQPDGTFKTTFDLKMRADAPWGALFATRFEVDVYGKPFPDADPVAYMYDVFVTGMRFGDLHSFKRDAQGRTAPSTVIGLGRIARGQAFQHTILVASRSREPFELTKAVVTEEALRGAQARVERVSPSEWAVILYGTANSSMGSSRGVIHVHTDRPDEPVLVFHYTGYVQ